MWREEDFMQRSGNDSGVIPRLFDVEKEPVSPHCRREN
jgi:hypothetical protein